MSKIIENGRIGVKKKSKHRKKVGAKRKKLLKTI